MRRLAANSRADLLREWRDGRLSAAAAALFHFAPAPDQVDAVAPEAVARSTPEASRAADPLPPAAQPRFPRERPPLALLRAVQLEPLAALPPPPITDPVREEELRTPFGKVGVPYRPLIRWAGLAGWLRRSLGHEMEGSVLDLRRLIRGVARGEPVLRLPRRRRRVWASQAVLLLDESREMRPFLPDLQWLRRQLERERGRNGFKVLPVREPPQPRDLARFPVGCPVLAVSAMGQYIPDSGVRSLWRSVGLRLLWLGHSLYALSPCPRRRWDCDIASIWSPAVWDRGLRLPRTRVGRHVPTPDSEPLPAVEELLDLLAPARRVSPALLRVARFLQPSRSDVGVEWEAWFHSAGWRSVDAFGFRPGPEQVERLRRRSRSAGAVARAATAIDRWIQVDHDAHGPALAREAAARVALSSPGPGGDPESFGRYLARVLDRLREQVGSGVLRSGFRRVDDLARWIHEMVPALTPEMRAHPSIREPLAQCLALADLLEHAGDTELASGIDLEAYAAESRAAPFRPGAWAHRWEIGVVSDSQGMAARIVGRAEVEPGASGFRSLASLTVGPGSLIVEGAGWVTRRFEIEQGDGCIELPLQTPVPLGIRSRWDRLTVERFSRPGWARRVWQDRFGLAAEFVIGEVPFVLRWIPPGRFLMGSPEDEPGRHEDEGPQDEVTIGRGFWMGETPVTQAQWRAVVEATNWGVSAGQLLDPAPSHFRGPAELPVEKVSWIDCQRFCLRLNALLGEGPGFGLPSEAHWEYACRAGTSTALYTGPLTLRGVNDGPELDAIAWYGGNSGQDLEVENPWDSSEWPKKQRTHTKAGTHRVKRKQPNAWGLYDMIGNVWEWCGDRWLEGAYRLREVHTQDAPLESEEVEAGFVSRGGSWDCSARRCRAAIRLVRHPGFCWDGQGFRLAAGQEFLAAEPGLRDEARRPGPREAGRRR